MRSFVPERFDLVRILREDRRSKTLVANDNLLDRNNIILKIIRKDCIQCDRAALVDHFSWQIGVQHSHFAAVLDAGFTKQQDLYYVREYLPPSELYSFDPIATIKALASAIAFLASYGRFHGAITPSNVFVVDGRLRLTDSKIVGIRSNGDEEFVRFSAPEILRDGIGGSIEGDLYSLGAIVYRLVTGHHLFEDLDQNRLKSKYMFASPGPITALPHVSQSTSELVMQLLDKNPKKRTVAFAALKHTIAVGATAAHRAALVGREGLLRQSMDVVLKKPKSLRILFIEGEVGIGKSRFIEEMRTRCMFEGLALVVFRCTRESDGLGLISEGLHRLARANLSSSQSRSEIDCTNCSPTAEPTVKKYLLEKTISDLAGLLSLVAKRIPMVFTIEDIDRANSATTLLLEQLSFRAHELPLTMVMTGRSQESEPRLIETMTACMGDDFARLHLTTLTEQDSATLTHFLTASAQNQPTVFQLSGGNPLFIEHYANCNVPPTSIANERVVEATASMLLHLKAETRSMLQILSVFTKPVGLNVLSVLCDENQNLPDFHLRLPMVERLGLIRRIENTVEIKYPVLRARLYSSIPKRVKLHLNANIFRILKEVGSDAATLAHHAIEAGLFTESARLYRDLANLAYEDQNYQAALIHYQRFEECARRSESKLPPNDKLHLARCYMWTGKQKRARQICEELLSEQEVKTDPELLSSVYTAFAKTLARVALKQRIHFHQLAIECLPKNSPRLSLRYLQLCGTLLTFSDTSGAREAFERAEQATREGNGDPKKLNPLRGSLLLNTADFKGAAACFLSADHPDSEKTALLNNAAFCFETLGDLRSAFDYQVSAQKLAIETGVVPLQIVSLGNLGSIKTKLGKIHDAEQLFKKALNSIERLRTADHTFDITRFYSTYFDAALHAIQVGDYRRAADLLKLRTTKRPVFDCDKMFCGLIECTFFVAICATGKFHRRVQRLKELDISGTPFFQVEQTLLDVRLPDISPETKRDSLQRALRFSEQDGGPYQECRVLNELGTALLELNEKQEAQECARRALRLARSGGYKILAARVLLLSGLACEKRHDQRHWLLDAMQLASEIGVNELVAEVASSIGSLDLASGNVVTAQEYLIRSTSITNRLAEGVPIETRSKYLDKSWRRRAQRDLEVCNQARPQILLSITQHADAEKYFRAAYRLTVSAAAAKSAEVLLRSIEGTLKASFFRPAVIILKGHDGSQAIAIRIKLSEELVKRVQLIGAQMKNRVYFGPTDQLKETIAWIPLRSEIFEGGIYVACRKHEPAFNEREIEFLTIIGTIGTAALENIETRKAEYCKTPQSPEFHNIIGASKAIKEVYSQIEMAAGNAATVLVEGESGTGKELVAKAIHAVGPRAKEAFVAVDCGAIPETLIEAELFGAKKGSYTGAVADRPGLFEAAHRGTIFLDEISNTTPALQAKLLRVIQEREVRRIGETKDRAIDVRLIVASNQSLETLANEGRFRKDLLYRLKVLHIKVPPLRNRRDDIPMLAHAFLQKLNSANKMKKYFAPGIINHLSTQKFPGNVRELQNAIERAFFSAKGIVITEVPLEAHAQATATGDEVQSWFKDLSEGRKDFWSAVHNRYKRRDISREKVVALVDFGLRSTRGSYKTMASMFRLKEKEYRRFMDFLRRNECLLDFRPYRKAAANVREG